MQKYNPVLELDIVDVNDDLCGPYVRIQAKLGDEGLEILFGLDKFTYVNLKKIFHSRYFDNLPGLKYKYRLIVGGNYETYREDINEQQTYFAKVECVLGNKRKYIKFACSELYISNIIWFNTFRSIAELQHLDWSKRNDIVNEPK